MSKTKIKAGGFDVDVITGTTALAEVPASTDEFLISDGGTIKRIDFSHIPVFTKLASTNIVDTQTTTVSFTDVFSSSFRSYYIHCPVVSSRTDGDQIKARLISSSGDFTSSNYQSGFDGFSDAGDTDVGNVNGGSAWLIIDTSDSSSSNTENMASFNGWIHQPNDTTHKPTANFMGCFRADSNKFVGFTSGHQLGSTTAFTGIKFLIDSSSFQNFTATIYGVNL